MKRSATGAHRREPIVEDDFSRLDKRVEFFMTFSAGILLPIILGFITVPALLVAGVANDQSQYANQIALLSLCSNYNEVKESLEVSYFPPSFLAAGAGQLHMRSQHHQSFRRLPR